MRVCIKFVSWLKIKILKSLPEGKFPREKNIQHAVSSKKLSSFIYVCTHANTHACACIVACISLASLSVHELMLQLAFKLNIPPTTLSLSLSESLYTYKLLARNLGAWDLPLKFIPLTTLSALSVSIIDSNTSLYVHCTHKLLINYWHFQIVEAPFPAFQLFFQ